MSDDPLDGDPGDPGGDTVTLSADASPFEKALDRAAAKVNEWSTKVEDRFAHATSKIASFTKDATSLLDELADSDRIGDLTGSFAKAAGEGLGALAGGALGTVFGPATAAIGSKIGGLIGGKIGPAVAKGMDADDIVAAVEPVLKKIDAQVNDVRQTWSRLAADAADAFKPIKGLFAGLDLADLTKGGTGDLSKKVNDLFKEVLDNANEFGKQVTARVADLIDAAVERWKKPFAALADNVQAQAVEFGLVADSVNRWGDSLRGVEDAGAKAIGGIAYGLGTLKDTFDVVAGTLRVGLGSAFGFVAKQALEGFALIGDALDSLPDGVKQLLGGGFDKGAQQFRDAAEFVGKVTDELVKMGVEQAARGLQFESGARFRGRAVPGVAEGREANAAVDTDRAVKGAIDLGLAAALAAAAAVKPDVAAATKTVEATIDGSREAARLAVADSTRGVGGDVQQKIADQARQNVDATKKVGDEVKGLRGDLAKSPPLKVV